MQLTFGFSPCPNDTFMFEPIVSGRVDLSGTKFDIHLADVEQLNKAALECRWDVTKLSFNAYTRLYTKYQLLTAGSALGNNCGPLLISREKLTKQDVSRLRIAIPGYHTTAYLLLKYAFPQDLDTVEFVFSDIENAVLDGRADAGLIIHENRFTYQDRGLYKIADLGEIWEQSTGYPIPLGGIAVRRDLPEDVKKLVNTIVSNSIVYAFDHPGSGREFIRKNAQEMNDKVMQAHIDLYVNEYSKNIGTAGRAAVEKLFKTVDPHIKDDTLKTLFVC